MKLTTEADFKDMLSKISDMCINFEDEHDVTIGSQFSLLSIRDKEEFVFNGAGFVKQRINYEKVS